MVVTHGFDQSNSLCEHKRVPAALQETERVLLQTQRALPDTAPRYVPGSLTRVHRFPRRVEVTFTDESCIVGVQLAFARFARELQLKVVGIKQHSLAARVPEDIQVGMTVVRINGTRAELLDRNMIGNLLKRRPVCVVFSSEPTVNRSSIARPTEAAAADKVNRRDKAIVAARQKLQRAVAAGILPQACFDAIENDKQMLSRYSLIVNAKPIEVTFVERGNLGLVFAATDGPTGPIVLESIEPGSLGAKKKALYRGLVLVEMQGRSVIGRPCRCVVSEMQSESCPLTLVFRKGLNATAPPESGASVAQPQRIASRSKMPISTELWMVLDSAGPDGVNVRLLPSTIALSIGTAAPGTTLNVTEREGDWVKVIWQAGAKCLVERGGTRDGGWGTGWVLVRNGCTLFLRPTSTVELQQATTTWLLPISKMREAASSDDPNTMSEVLNEFEHLMDPRVHQAWKQLEFCLVARQKEVRHEDKIKELEHKIFLAKSMARAS